MPRKHWRFLNHWRAKIASLVLAIILWLVIKHGMSYPAPQTSATTAPGFTPQASPQP